MTGNDHIYRIILMVAAVVIFAAEGQCGEVDSVLAATVAKNFYAQRFLQASPEQIKKAAAPDIELELVHREFQDAGGPGSGFKSARIPLYYAFNIKDDQGFVIVSGDDRTVPVLGYAFSGSFCLTDQPPAFKDWMESCRKQITGVIGLDMSADEQTENIWEAYSNTGMPGKEMQVHEVLPLITAGWGQGCYYNLQCPGDNSGPCMRAFTGCLAVAMAQIMRYWEHPVACNPLDGYMDEINQGEPGKGIPGSDYGWIPDVPSTVYNWSIMPDRLTSESEGQVLEHVSTLLYHSGVALKTNYGPEGSGASFSDAVEAFVSGFHYSASIQSEKRSEYISSSWANMIRVELDQGRPVLYKGTGKDGGHAFVCDGYQDEAYFHFNWGWEGKGDGYFYLYDLAPGLHHFNESQQAILGIFPDEDLPKPCENIISINGCGPDFMQEFTGGGQGAWEPELCGWKTPGGEEIYSFVAPETGIYSLEVSEVDGYVDCAWSMSCDDENGWTCISDISSPGSYGEMSWTAGSTYYLLFDDEDTDEGLCRFYIRGQDMIPDAGNCHTDLDRPATPHRDAPEIKIFPNPVRDRVYLQPGEDVAGRLEIVLLDPVGRQVFRREYERLNMDERIEIDLRGAASGVYLLRVYHVNGIITRKIIRD